MQTRKRSFKEALTSTAIGYLINLCGQLVIFPALGIPVRFHQNLAIGLFFTVISVARQYIVRRWFNRKDAV